MAVAYSSRSAAARPAVREPARLAGTNSYVIVNDCLSLRNHPGLRDVLRAQAALRDAYAAVKRAASAPSCRDNRDPFP
jgi:GrpB-like predicted nucleotidyltransferase (UPF0157 family)